MRLVSSLLATAGAALALGAATAAACTVHAASNVPVAQPSAVAAVFPDLGGPLAKLAPLPLGGPTATEAAAAALPVTSHRLRLVGHADPGAGYSADVSAHRGHAYLSSFSGQECPAAGVRVFDLAQPSRPVHVATFADGTREPELAGTWTEKTIVQRVSTPSFAGDLAVTSIQHCREEAFRGFALYDVSVPSAPRRLALVRTDPRGSHEIWLQPRGGAAYVYTAIIDSETRSSPDYDPRRQTASTPGSADFRVYDVSNPTAPAQVSEWGAWRELGLPPHTSGSTNFVHSVRSNAAGTRAYLSYWDLGTVILDTTEPAAPRYLGRTPPADSAHSVALARNGTVLVETHEIQGGLPTFYDITTPRRPRRLGQLSIPGARRPPPAGMRGFMNGVHDPDVSANRAFFSWYSQGVVAADITRPGRPRVIAQFLPAARGDGGGSLCHSGACRAVWGIALDRGYVLASDMVSGLYVLKLERRT